MKTRLLTHLSLILVSILGFSPKTCAQSVSLTAAQLTRVGQKIWQNECAGSLAGLTSWNSGEDFASLALKREWLTADLHLSLIPQGFSPLGQGHPRHSRFESKKPCETKPWRNSMIFHSRI